MTIEKYYKIAKNKWDDFVKHSKNASFLFYRDYMEYHENRFTDHSYIISHNGKIVAILPACREGDTLVSHGGLTYGGVLSGDKMTTPMMLGVFDALLVRAKQDGFSQIIYKPCPSVYHAYPADEDLYALYASGARLVRRDVSSILNPSDYPKMQERRKRSIKKASKVGIECRESDNLKEFWDILCAVLKQNHGTSPVHSLSEIKMLQCRFPRNIRLFGAYQEEQLVAGTLVFENTNVAHTQYIASSDAGRNVGALDFVFNDLISKEYANKRWLSFGVSTENQGKLLNQGLIEQKEGFGARACVHDVYQIDV